ncbi:MAG: xanthine dehydrogenase family Fe-S subunit [Noviherbaspirillum sp.]
MKTINLTVNGKRFPAQQVEPRTHLADFVREKLNLTGTHLGCEHGVCGACTVLVDGVPVRSCITLAVACDGAEVTTIEGQDEDECMRQLRKAFAREHALQCGFCTPGMLASARDVVLRMPDATEEDVRVAMSGNLCRCTGYVGIVRAVQSVIAERKEAGLEPPPDPRSGLGPAGSGHAGAAQEAEAVLARARRPAAAPDRATAPVAAPAAAPAVAQAAALEPGKGLTTLNQSFSVDFPREKVWEFFGRLGDVTTCLPGASLLKPATETHVEPKLRVKVGPIVAEFEGTADVVRDPATHTGLIHGSARDTRSPSATRGEIRYSLHPEKGGTATRVEVEVGFALTGPLAQFSRSSIVRDIAKRMTDAFAANLRQRMGQDTGAGAQAAAPAPAAELNAGSLVFSVILEKIRALFAAPFGRR